MRWLRCGKTVGRGGKLESMSHVHVHVHTCTRRLLREACALEPCICIYTCTCSCTYTCTRLLLREACALERHVEALSRRLDLASIALEVRQLGVGLVGEVVR